MCRHLFQPVFALKILVVVAVAVVVVPLISAGNEHHGVVYRLAGTAMLDVWRSASRVQSTVDNSMGRLVVVVQ